MKERSPLGDWTSLSNELVQSGDLQDLDIFGIDFEVRGQQAAQFLRIAAFTQRVRSPSGCVSSMTPLHSLECAGSALVTKCV